MTYLCSLYPHQQVLPSQLRIRMGPVLSFFKQVVTFGSPLFCCGRVSPAPASTIFWSSDRGSIGKHDERVKFTMRVVCATDQINKLLLWTIKFSTDTRGTAVYY